MSKMNFFQKLSWNSSQKIFYFLDEQIKIYITEILTLRQIREQLIETITELRSENHRLRMELRRLKE